MRLQETKHYQITRNGKASTKSACNNKKATQIYLKNKARICTPQQGAANAPAAHRFAPVCGSQKTHPSHSMSTVATMRTDGTHAFCTHKKFLQTKQRALWG
ncbi:hypothetical protein [Janthinobacterium sp. DSP2-3-3]|uniref:hypothetical protein n=1 Tax=Janthinobacterium sp. DSP2-3-3 TaxID=2804596 RepID=UPI003CE7AE11